MKRGPLSILVVDDIPAMRESIGAALSAAGHRPSYAENGKEALELILANKFDAIVTDLWMPEMDGLDLIKRVRREQMSLRVFAITGGGPRLTMEAASSIAEIWGAEKVFFKPFDESLLIEALMEAD